MTTSSEEWEWNKADYNAFLFRLNCILGDHDIQPIKIKA